MRRELARRLESVADFADPAVELEQYRTPADLAAHLVQLASLHDDVADRTVVDLGTGTGMLALGAALLGARRVVGVDIDDAALRIASANESRISPPVGVDWIRGDATRPPLARTDGTVVMNPPFGAQRDQRHADRAFLAAAADVAAVSYSIHNEGSRDFVESFASDNGGTVTHAFRADFDVPHQFDFHEEERRTLDVEVFRVEWSGSSSPSQL